MKVLFVGDEKSLIKNQLYKVREVKNINKTILYKVEVDGKYKWLDSKQFRYNMKWVK